MATKSFLFWLSTLLTISVLSISCQNLQTRDDLKDDQTMGEQVGEEKDTSVTKPAFLTQEAPRLGVILGGGGALAYAHIGFLQQLETQKIPVHSIAGLEWGALIAGAYAKDKKAHAIEWKLLKLPAKNFQNRSFFSSGDSAVSVNGFDQFLAQAMGKRQTTDLEIPFACAVNDTAKKRSRVLAKGSLKSNVRACWPYPPHFKASRLMANPVGVGALAKFLRAQGAEVIWYVDVISSNQLLGKKGKKGLNQMIWVQNKGTLQEFGQMAVDEWIQIPLSGQNMTSYKNLRSIIRTGQLKTQSKLKGLAKKYAY